MTLKLAALASGVGSNVAAIQKCIEDGRLDAKISVIISNDESAPVLDLARALNIPYWAKDHKNFEQRELFDDEILSVVKDTGADTVALAGYMRLLSPFFIQAFPGRILNVHPALLPAFPGTKGIEDSLAYGVRISGVTVHFVDEIMDSGPIIIQAAVPARASDSLHTLRTRIQDLEHRIFPQALQWLAEERLSIDGRKVFLKPAGTGKARVMAECGKSELGYFMISPALESF